MKAWMGLTTLAILVVWVFARKDDGPPEPPKKLSAVQPDDQPVRVADAAERFTLAQLLEKPRAELAELGAEQEQQILAQDRARQEGHLVFNFLPGARFPMVWPIWQKASYSPKYEMILPPYFANEGFDPVLALHLARYGDVEGARKLAAPNDAATRAEIDRFSLSRNFPAEWTRLVALILYRAHFAVAEGNNEGVRTIASLHRQLQTLLDKEARHSPLGTALMSRGRFLLHQAVLVWSPNEGQDEWIKLASESLSDWGDFAPSLPRVETPEKLAKWLGGKVQGLLVSGGNAERALDVLEIPLPHHAVQNVVGHFDEAGKLQQILVIYAPEVVEHQEMRPFAIWPGSLVPDSTYQASGLEELKRAHFGYWLEEELAWQPNPDFAAEVHLSHANSFVGPLVCILPQSADRSAKVKAIKPLPRDFGPVNVNRTFEGNHRFFGWNQAGPRVAVSDPKVLAELKLPFPGQKISQAILNRDSKLDLVADVQLALVKDAKTQLNLVDVASPFWEIAGASQINVTGKLSNDSIEFIWNDAATKLCLRLPHHNSKQMMLEASDHSGKSDEQRLTEARQFDAAEREVRWASRKIVSRLGRGLEPFDLGITRAELTKRVGTTKSLRREISGGDLLVFPGSLSADDDEPDWILRQSAVRFDEGRLSEMKLRFVDGPGKKAGSAQQVLKSLRERVAPEVLPEEPVPGGEAKTRTKHWRWQDDATLIEARINGDGVEVMIKDCPAAYPNGKPAPPLAWLPRGPAPQCVIGMSKNALLKTWQIKTPETAGDAILLRPADKSQYDAILVWFDDDGRVLRVVARHRPTDQPSSTAVLAGKAVVHSWGQQAYLLGWPWTQIATRQGVVLAWSNHDDLTQVRMFWRESENGLRVFTEWK